MKFIKLRQALSDNTRYFAITAFLEVFNVSKQISRFKIRNTLSSVVETSIGFSLFLKRDNLVLLPLSAIVASLKQNEN